MSFDDPPRKPTVVSIGFGQLRISGQIPTVTHRGSTEAYIHCRDDESNMAVSSGAGSLQTPERLDGRFSLVVGLYVASLLSPSLVFVVGQRFGFGSWPIALGSLGALGVALTSIVARVATRNGAFVAWFDSD